MRNVVAKSSPCVANDSAMRQGFKLLLVQLFPGRCSPTYPNNIYITR